MCGITGFAAPALTGRADEVLTSMLALIHHRGPDEAGYYVDDGVAMGTARLSIVDIDSGSQPIGDPTERFWICFNGELYNHVELRAELAALGRPFRTRSDTEVVLQAWIQWGPDCLRRFNGAFAFAVRDTEADELFLARDRFGKRPLFYVDRPGELLFASELKAFRAVPGFRYELDGRELASTYATWTPLPDRSVFQGVRQLPMGAYMVVRGDRREVRTYEPLAVDALPFEGSADEAVELVRDSLHRAVELRLRSDVEVGVYLSGGLDSSIVTQLATRLSPHQVRTFSVSFEDAEFDESRHQELVADHLGTRHSALKITGADIAAHFPDAVEHAEAPAFRTAFVPMFLLSRHVRDAGIKTILSGEGADEAFLGYSLFRETTLRAEWGELSEQQRLDRLAGLNPELAHFGSAHRKHLLGLFDQFATERMPGLFSHEMRFQNGRFATRLLKDRADPFADLLSLVRDTPGYSALSATQKAQWLEYKTLLAGYLLSTQGERMGLAHAVENRCPFLDPDVVRAARAVNLRFDDGSEEKRVLKDAFRAVLPERSVTRPKQPYRAPGSAAFKEQRPEYLELLLSESELSRIEPIDPVFARKLVNKIMATPAAEISTKEDQAFVLLLSTAVLHHRFVQGAAVPDVALNLRTTVDRRGRARLGGTR